jgi:hypothetical protein
MGKALSGREAGANAILASAQMIAPWPCVDDITRAARLDQAGDCLMTLAPKN